MKTLAVLVIGLSTMIVFAGCQAKDAAEESAVDAEPADAAEGGSDAETVKFSTSDGWEIVGTYRAGRAGDPAAILLHMLPADRRSYDDFGARLAGAGFNVLAIDSRGHGESLQHGGKTRNYQDFSDDDHRSSTEDVAAAKGFLAERGADTSRLVIVGASIGANFAVIHAAGDEDVRAVVLLSPGLDYHGVKTLDAMAAYDGRPAYLVASEEDTYAAESIGKLHEVAGEAEFKLFNNAGHGTRIFDAEPTFEGTLASWLAAQVK
jgi:pimeloyl-ACP methyl ester carboxylesterase